MKKMHFLFILIFLFMQLLSACGMTEEEIIAAVRATNTAIAFSEKEINAAVHATNTAIALSWTATPSLTPTQTSTPTTSPTPSQTPLPPFSCNPGETLWDEEGDVSAGHFDLLKAETWLEGEILHVVIYLRKIPEELTIHRDTNPGDIEFEWNVSIDIDHNDRTGYQETFQMYSERIPTYQKGVEYILGIIRFNQDDIERSAPVSEILKYSARLFAYQGNEYLPEMSSSEVSIDFDENTIIISGRIPGITDESLLSVHTNQGSFRDQPLDSICR